MYTTTTDYVIDLSELTKTKILFKYDHLEIYLATWRYQTICVKEIPNNSATNNELQILSKCINPRICQFLGAHIGDKYTSIIFEYMENGDLHHYITTNRLTLTKEKKIRMMIDITLGLHYLHARKPQIILHRDLKPSNILINKHGEAKISDFGISKLIENDGKIKFCGHTAEKGTYIWMSPEVLKHENYNYKSDIYCLGLIIYFIWTERLPFEEKKMNTIQLIFAKFQNSLNLFINDFEELNTIIKKCCNPNPNERPNSDDVIIHLNMCLTL